MICLDIFLFPTKFQTSEKKEIITMIIIFFRKFEYDCNSLLTVPYILILNNYRIFINKIIMTVIIILFTFVVPGNILLYFARMNIN